MKRRTFLTKGTMGMAAVASGVLPTFGAERPTTGKINSAKAHLNWDAQSASQASGFKAQTCLWSRSQDMLMTRDLEGLMSFYCPRHVEGRMLRVRSRCMVRP